MAFGTAPSGSTPEQFAALIKSEIVKYEKIVRDSGAQAD
jgi:tripartite-type tricarboxylate transporter receptor subunit TctC